MKKVTALILLLVLSILIGCNSIQKYKGPYDTVNGSFACIDDLGRRIVTSSYSDETKTDKKVGMFYFLCNGQHDVSGPYDVSKILEKDPNAAESNEAWIKAGGGPLNTNHFWSEPLLGYYVQNDEYVVRKHIQMLIDAGIDYLICDKTNGPANTYTYQSKLLFKVLDEYSKEGFNVPEVTFYTNTVSGESMDVIYNNFYAKNPEYHYLWFQWDGKPLIIGDESQASDIVKETFRIKANQWPNEAKKDDGWPWIEFERNLTKNAVYGLNGRKEVVSVSPAQHLKNLMSSSALYGLPNNTRSFHDGKNDTKEDAVLYGYNFAEQWEWAIAQNPETIFVTQWNEWTAGRLGIKLEGQPIVMYDTCDANNSRDIEPSNGILGDNYYMQLCHYVAKFKKTKSRVNIGSDVTIDINKDWSQWETVTSYYKDYTNDTIERNSKGFGKLMYTNNTGRNDMRNIKVAKDKSNVYFYVDTVYNLSNSTDSNWMTLFISTGNKKNNNWYNYDYIINRTSPSGNECTIEKSTGGWNWESVGKGKIRYEDNKLMLAIPLNLLGYTDENIIDLQFKWADNYQMTEGTNNYEIWTFYKDGDSAPYGRMNYVFSNVR